MSKIVGSHNEVSPHTVRMAKIKNIRNNNCWQECGEKENSALSIGIQTCVATVKNSVALPQKLKNGITIWSTNSTAGYLPQKHENTN